MDRHPPYTQNLAFSRFSNTCPNKDTTINGYNPNVQTVHSVVRTVYTCCAHSVHTMQTDLLYGTHNAVSAIYTLCVHHAYHTYLLQLRMLGATCCVVNAVRYPLSPQLSFVDVAARVFNLRVDAPPPSKCD